MGEYIIYKKNKVHVETQLSCRSEMDSCILVVVVLRQGKEPYVLHPSVLENDTDNFSDNF